MHQDQKFAWCVNGKTDKTAQLAYEIETGVYTHIIMGPEIAADWFQSIARDPSFKKRVFVVPIDELYLMALWGNGIRPQYAQLSLFRRRLMVWLFCHLGPEDPEHRNEDDGFPQRVRVLPVFC
jgi:hypothetical protein